MFRGIDIRENDDRIIFRVLLQDSDGALVISGTTLLRLYELQSDGTLKSYDFNDDTYKSGALTTETQALTHKQGNNATTDTGLWTWTLPTLSGHTAGNIYFAMVNNSIASPIDQIREFQFDNPLGIGVPIALDGGSADLGSMLTKMADDNAGANFDATTDSLNKQAAQVAALNNISAAQVNTETDAALADYDGPTNAEMVDRTLVAAEYATIANQVILQKLMESDWDIDQAASPWELVVYEKGTANVLFKKKLYQADGTTPVTSIDHLVGKQEHTI